MGKARIDEERSGFDKWEMYKLLRGENLGPCRLPNTARLSASNLRTFLNRYHRVYVKPTGTWGGSNISVMEQRGKLMVWVTQERSPAKATVAQVLKHYSGVPAIVQEAIPAVSYSGYPCDIRVHMQRDIDGNWVYAGELVRVGGQGIVSNVGISHGQVLPFEAAVPRLLSVSTYEIGVLKQKLVEIGTRIGSLFDDYSQIDEVGIDLALDTKRHFWLIEVNTNDALGGPSHELFRQLPDQTMYNQMQERASSRTMDVLQFFFDALSSEQTE